jgi:hypothetical protein
MPQFISGPGIGLPFPQNLYPSELQNAPYDSASNQVTVPAGFELPIPAGDWFIGLGEYLILEFLDPVLGIWTPVASAGWQSGIIHVTSDGFNLRIANRLACPVGAVILVGGSGYVQGSTTISVTGGGGSTWLPIIGGSLNMNTATIVTANAGAGYGMAPIVIIPPPPAAANNPNGVGGIQASGYATISGGTISGFTFTNPGAGYTGTTFNVTALANPTDPNAATGITLGTITFTVTGSGSLTGVLCTNPGAPLSNPANISLTVAGVGTSASINPVVLQTIVTASVVGGSTLGFDTGSLAMVTTVGGYPPQGSITNSPEFLFLKGRPRQAAISLAVGGTGTIAAQTGNIYDGGFFYAAPVPLLVFDPLIAATGTIIGTSTIVLTMGSRPDIAILQPAP